ncbi:DUF5132 domain-containing protein [Streptomyces fuscichromogenes]|uniref:DUF5132 domain-containing protein n=1 Tax=Streptomyces fuscichromogenes TaxID=1324013 RepID=A0A917XK12_9ACTN|nr:DUF5132 domain-containing protein [Streptomyces fuscichromogenes]GGN33977.1 hypothetical protein GCM10011578_074290 [Streptomyces fuscichromogenes]
MPPVVPPFLIGLIAASLVKRLGKPLVRGVVKASVGLGLEVKRAVHEAGEGIHDLAAEATAGALAAQTPAQTPPAARLSVGAPESGTAGRTGAAAKSAPAAAGAHEGRTGAQDKPAGKARGAGTAAAKAR